MKKLIMAGLLALAMLGSMFAAKPKVYTWVDANFKTTSDNENGFKWEQLDDGWLRFAQSAHKNQIAFRGEDEYYKGFEGIAKVVSGDENSKAVFAFNFVDFNGYWRVYITAGGDYNVEHVRSGKAEALIKDKIEGAVKAGFGQENKIRVEADGKDKKVYINDVLVHTIAKQGSSSGKIRIGGWFSNGEFTVSEAKLLRYQK